MNTQKIHHIASLLRGAQERKQPCEPIRDLIAQAADGGDLIAAAYAVQRYNTELRLQQGARLVGRKIGLTSLAVQKQLGVDSPDFGCLFEDMAYIDGQEVAWSDILQPKVEAEIALVLEHDLTLEVHATTDVIAATAYAVAAIEIVGSRIANWDIRLADTVADNASSAAFVLGSTRVPLRKIDLVSCGMDMQRRGETVSSGSGAACLGNPLNAAVWLANMMVQLGTPLRSGDVVMTGALGPMVAVQPGDSFAASIKGLGSVSTVFSGKRAQ